MDQETAWTIAATQRADGSIPWEPGRRGTCVHDTLDGMGNPALVITKHDSGQAREPVADLLGSMADRWRHTVGVAARAAELVTTVAEVDRELLVAAAWLHDIGYARPVADTGFHPLDGARYLDRLGWPRRIAALVAHHSGAHVPAEVLGVREQLDAYPREQEPVADALAHADQTLDRHGPDALRPRAPPACTTCSPPPPG